MACGRRKRPLSISGSVAKTGAKADSGQGAARRTTGNGGSRGNMMAQQEMKAAEETYTGFISLFKVGSIITAVVVIGVVLLIAS
jgi:hypothetical protein